MTASPHHKVREDWLALVREDVLAPGQPIFDCHHHLWDRPEGRYRAEELMADMGAGHDVRASLFVQCRTGYRTTGPEALRPVGEVETVLDWTRGRDRFPAGLVAMADLQLGDRVRPVLDALTEAGQGQVKGIRNTTAWHADPAVRSNPTPPPQGLMRTDAFLDGARAVAAHGLTLDVWAYQTQLDEVRALAEAVPELAVIVDHCGGPLGVGPHDRFDPDNFRAWRESLAQVAALPNTRIKIGGFGLGVFGWRYADDALPPHSDTLANDWAPWVETCLDLFGPDRAMFESNFPVDKGQVSYRTLWNAFKRLAAPLSRDEQDALFWRSAARTYGIDEQIFSDDIGRIPS
ncbi:amidohydrolase family protein [Pseudooceanicola sp. 216_PA32_1]|uniref:Amidohydrolase family protein n=1 Tax=Pseudooceanicola pacificus TaxID=2676438 RepID=A0A844WH48_9RHOB|nr:amidohydrolase family protein [Pseudooceanicola pacificus]MWB79669.1 amidohydrolase family protein [Pseudooceanicola pacificus]